MKQRSAQWFVRECRKRAAIDPASPIRFDVTEQEVESVHKAYHEIYAARKRGEPRAAWDWAAMVQRHRDPDKRNKGLRRVAFMPPGWERPNVDQPRADLAKRWQRFVDDVKRCVNEGEIDEAEIQKHLVTFNTGEAASNRAAADAVWDMAMYDPVEFVALLRLMKAMEAPAIAGVKMFGAQAQRRGEWEAQRRGEWERWQRWIDEQRRLKGWSFACAQRKAAEQFSVNLKSIQRRTTDTKKAGQSD